MIGYFTRSGKPIAWDEYVHLQVDDPNYCRIGDNTVAGVRVSTVFLGCNHAHGGGERPLLFETMIFGGDYDQEMVRYCTEGEALRGHRRAVNNIRRGRTPW